MGLNSGFNSFNIFGAGYIPNIDLSTFWGGANKDSFSFNLSAFDPNNFSSRFDLLNYTPDLTFTSSFTPPNPGSLMNNGLGFNSPSLFTQSSFGSDCSFSDSYDFGKSYDYSTGRKRFTKPKTRRSSYCAVSEEAKANLGPEFLEKVKQIAININCDYKDLLAVMNAESGLNTEVKNKSGYKYYGLIQFGESAAGEIGTTIDELVQMTPLEQLDYVEKYYMNVKRNRGWGNQRVSGADLYAMTLAPAKAKQHVLYEQGSKAYTANKNIDLTFGDGDGKIDKNDIQNFIDSKRVNENIFC